MQGYIGAYYLRTEPRKYLRLSKYHYRMSGYYYITLCTQNRQCLFGTIENNDMVLNKAGQMIHNLWQNIGNIYHGFKNDVFVVMPNHLHGILMICQPGPARGPAPTESLPNIMRNFKSLTTTYYIRGVEENKFEPFEKKLWQRSYYEHIIRKNKSLAKIQQYIIDNPKNWAKDPDNL